MKKPRPFPSLLTVLLGFRRFGPVPLLLWFGLSTPVLYAVTIFSPALWASLQAQGQTRQEFFGAQFAVGCALYVFLMMLSTPTMLELAAGMPVGTLIEFLFTRALDRRIFLRAERVAQFIVLIGPLAVNLAISPFAPVLDFDSEQPRFRHETELFAGWLVWAGTLCIYLVAGYHVLVAKRLKKLVIRHTETKRGVWLVLVVAYAPVIMVLPVIAIFAAIRVNIYGECFQFFIRHMVISLLGLLALVAIVQPMSERRIRKLEFF
jgi:hypothetical protein